MTTALIQSDTDTDLSTLDALKAEVELFVRPTLDVVVTDKAAADGAIETGKSVKKLMKRIEDCRDSAVRPLNERVKSINKYAQEITAPLDKAIGHLKSQLLVFENEQAKVRAAEAKRIEDLRREEARKAAEAKAKAEAEVEAKRAEERRLQEEKAKAEADAARAKAEEEAKKAKARENAAKLFGTAAPAAPMSPPVDLAAARAKAEEERQAQAARDKAEKDRLAEVARLDREAKEKDRAFKAQLKDVESLKVKGTRQIWKWKVVDISQVPPEFWMLNEQALNEAVTKGGVRMIAGIDIYPESIVAI